MHTAYEPCRYTDYSQQKSTLQMFKEEYIDLIPSFPQQYCILHSKMDGGTGNKLSASSVYALVHTPFS